MLLCQQEETMKGQTRHNDVSSDAYTSVDDALDIIAGSELRIAGTAISVSAAVINGISGTVGGITTDLVALVGGGQTGATALVAGMNNVITSATAKDSVKLPTAVAGTVVRVKNSAATAIDIFPFLADTIDALAANLAVTLEPGGTAQFQAISAVLWESDIDTSLTLNAPTTQKGALKLLAADNDDNYLVTLTNAAMGQAAVVSIPDPGAATANVLLTSAANDGAVVASTSVEIDRMCDSSAKIVTTTANLTLTQALHANRTVIVNKADGCDLVLPEATGTGDVYTIIFGTALTSNTHTITTADTTNADLVGHVIAIDLDSAQIPESFNSLQATGNDVITLNMTTQGGVSPYADYYVITDIVTDVWRVEGKFIVPAGSEPATPFSST